MVKVINGLSVLKGSFVDRIGQQNGSLFVLSSKQFINDVSWLIWQKKINKLVA